MWVQDGEAQWVQDGEAQWVQDSGRWCQVMQAGGQGWVLQALQLGGQGWVLQPLQLGATATPFSTEASMQHHKVDIDPDYQLPPAPPPPPAPELS